MGGPVGHAKRDASLLGGIETSNNSLLGFMAGFDVDTPDKGFAWHWPVLGLRGLLFTFGWLLLSNTERAWLNGRRPARLEAAIAALPKPATVTAK
jgi:hypothetical protein